VEKGWKHGVWGREGDPVAKEKGGGVGLKRVEIVRNKEQFLSTGGRAREKTRRDRRGGFKKASLFGRRKKRPRNPK